MSKLHERYRVAAIQMVSGPVVRENLDAAEALIAEAAGEGARLICLPENFCLIGRDERDKLVVREEDGRGPIQAFLSAAAARHKIWLVGGTLPMATADPERVHNTLLVFGDSGARVARYDKIHLFGFESGEERYNESNVILAGTVPVALDSPFGRLGLSVCYDIRFPELYRALGQPDLIFIPSAFTSTTGRAHWETLVRARAIENQAWVIAAAQGGTHPTGRVTHGHTMIVDPWGDVKAEIATGPGVAIAEVDPHFQARVRASLPALAHRVMS